MIKFKLKTVFALLIFVVIIISCSNSNNKDTSTNSSTKENTQTLGQNNTKEEVKTSQIKQTYKGNSSKVVKIKLNKGLAIFTLDYIGKSNFAVALKDYDGEHLELLANEIVNSGSFSGSKSYKIIRSGDYLLEITSSGNWIITTSD